MFKHIDKVMLGVDVGGSHISSALVSLNEGQIMEDSFSRNKVDSQSGNPEAILSDWLRTIKSSLTKLNGKLLQGIGIAMPGPFNYDQGISLIKGVHKYDALYGINIKEVFRNEMDIDSRLPILFENDACCFGVGESQWGVAKGFGKVIAITLGTGLGSCFINNARPQLHEAGVPDGGCLFNFPFKDGIAEDYISSHWITETYLNVAGHALTVKEIADQATIYQNDTAKKIMSVFGENLAELLCFWIQAFRADCLVIGGSIAQSYELFLPALTNSLLEKWDINIPIRISNKMELSALAGTSRLLNKLVKSTGETETNLWRKTSQKLLPSKVNKNNEKQDEYDLYPFTSLHGGKIFSGYESLSNWMASHKAILLDGYQGNDWNAIRENLAVVFRQKQIKVLWYEMSAFLKSEEQIDEMVRPYMGAQDSVWGKKTALTLEDFYQMELIKNLSVNTASYDLVILLGTGAGLSNWDAPVVYVDLPKNEIQYRMRAGAQVNVGSSPIQDKSQAYKRLYFVDWVILKEHRKKIKNRIHVIADGQWKNDITWAYQSSINEGLEFVSESVIRVRPWFEAGAWGGQWMKEHIPSLNKDEINYAWSFELIVPENGIIFESDENLLEVSFDWLMEHNSEKILGKDAERFGEEFPIRFDFLDTFDGGNLSIQCHPSLSYIQENFGEKITQDETYYILDSKEGAGVYLGFQEDINPQKFRAALEESLQTGKLVPIENYVQWHPSHKHDLFLIPNQTIHSSGANNLVLEISATPYIFTFKMYDWCRLDLDGKPRPINIAHAFGNLNFARKGKVVQEELISVPRVIETGDQYRLVHLQTHREHFYDVHRIEFLDTVTVISNNSCHVLMLVEGTSIIVRTNNGVERRFNYAETFIIPAAARSYQLINKTGKTAKVIKAFIK